jgi:hypothetical protein
MRLAQSDKTHIENDNGDIRPIGIRSKKWIAGKPYTLAEIVKFEPNFFPSKKFLVYSTFFSLVSFCPPTLHGKFNNSSEDSYHAKPF